MPYLYQLFLLFITLLLSSLSVQAEEQVCDGDALKVLGEHLKVKNFHSGEDGIIVSLACKQAPWNQQLTIVATAYKFYDPPESKNFAEYEKKIAVMVFNKKKKAIDSLYLGLGYEDASVEYGFDSFSIDTAKYYLNANTRAFGVRFDNAARKSGAMDHWFDDELTLYIKDGKHLKPVLDALCTESYQYGRYSNYRALVKVEMGSKYTNGYRNLKLKAQMTRITFKVKVDYREVEKRPQYAELIYDGNKYVVKDQKNKPWWLYYQGVWHGIGTPER